MAQHMGLDHHDMALYERRLSLPHTLSINLDILDLGENLLGNIDPAANEGQINLDTTADVTRSCTLSFQDPHRALQFDSDSPTSGAVYFDRMVRVWHRIIVPELDNERVSCPVFTGPLTKYDRTDDTVSIEAQGKESLALRGVPALTVPKGHNAVWAIRHILSERVGETRFAFPAHKHRLPKHVVVGWEDDKQPWVVCKRIAKSMGLHLFYDGAGVCRLRAPADSSVFRFHSGGVNPNILSPVQISHDRADVRNRVTVIGSKPAHRADANLPPSHALSAHRLRRNGVPMVLRELIQDDKVGSKSEAHKRAMERLKVYERMQFGTTFNAMPVPHLDELDPIAVDSGSYHAVDKIRQFSFPLTESDIGEGMTVGYNRAVALPRKHIRKP